MTDPLEEICGSSFWDLQVVWNTTNPDLTECFQKTVLVWIPCGFLWLFAPLQIYMWRKSTARGISWSGLNVSKLIISIIITSLVLVEMFHNVHLYINLHDIPPIDFYSPLIKCATLILAGVFMYAEKRCGTSSSGIVFIFWFLLCVAGIVPYRTSFLQAFDETTNLDQFSFVIHMVYYPLVVAEVILCCFSNSLPLKKLSEGEKKPSPELHASFISRVLFSWFDGMAILGYRRTLQYNDVWALNEDCKSQPISVKVHRHWKAQMLKYKSDCASRVSCVDGMVQVKNPSAAKKKRPSFFIVLCQSFGCDFLCSSLFELLTVALTFVNPLVLELLIKFIESDEPVWRGYFYGAIILTSAVIQSLVFTQYLHITYKISVKLRAAMISAVYTKALRLSNSARRASTVGEIVNLMAVDVQYFLDLIPELNSLWSAPLQIGIALYMLWGQLGPSVLAGLAVLVLLLPVNSYVINKTEKLQVAQMANKDLRVKLMNELLNGIKVLKMYAWEIPFAEQINKIRFKELSLLKTMAYLDAACDFIWRSAPFFLLLASFSTYVLVDSMNILDASKAFVSLTLFNVLQYPMVQMPLVLVGVIQARVSLNRMQEFLLSEELDPSSVTQSTTKDGEYPVLMEDGTFSWGLNDEPVLTNINLTVCKGQLVAIVGTVGTGKSSLLSAILGEMEKLQGTIKTQGSFAYTPQQAWIQNATVRENILFGSHYDLGKYNNIIEVCALERDIEILPAGSDTEIGEKGINLSGGQKQRVSLARAVYSDLDVYLLDDPLSAVDSHVGKHIFDKVIGPNGLLKEKTRLLVTHSITYLPQVDVIIVLKDKVISEVGSYQELLDKKGAFAEFLLTYLNEAESDDDDDDEALQEIKEELLTKLSPDVDMQRQFSHTLSKLSENVERPRHISISPQLSWESSHMRRRGESTCDVQEDIEQRDGKLVTEEAAESGQVNVAIYAYYLSSVGVWLALGTFILNVLAWTASIGTNMWLEVWSRDPLPINGTQDTALRDLRLGVYAALGFSFAFLMLAGTLTLVLNCVSASQFLHDQMLTTVIHSPMSFFDTTPVGRILNRFSQDLNVVDTKVPTRALYSLTTVLEIVGALIVIAIQTPIFIAALIPISALYYLFQRFYLMTSRQLKRMESITRSPIYTHFSETITGASIIRAYNKQSEFINESNRRVDNSQCYYYANLCCNRWLQVRLEFVGNLIVGCAIVFALLSKDNITSGSIGLSVTYAMSMTWLLNWCMRVTSDLEKDFVAVERIKEYVETSHEADWESKENKPPPNWPDQGCITFDKYKTRYREGLDLVLHGLTCNVTRGEKVGVVGRTGAGKSSLTLALFRIIEAAEGTILIDNIDISKLGLHDLRSKLTIIPQDPVLFCGTLRNNLDPFNAYTDEQVWTALKHSHLHSFVQTLPETLHYEIAEGGENLSVGQRQLVCLGRALLRKTKVLILDEATAAVDLETDDLIQATIRAEFAECTIITIAHRLNTIMDNDRVMVLDEGLITEFDAPMALLENTNSAFYKMAKDAGLV